MDAERLASPELYPLSFDATGDRVRLVPLEEEAYRVASFLDERLLASVGFGEWVPMAELREAMPRPASEGDFVFHLGHVGSTLLSRLLGESERVFSVREPAILRTLAIAELAGQDPEWLRDQARLFLALWARVWRPRQRSLLKATSFVSELAPLLMDLNPSAAAILMHLPASAHLAAILGGEASRAEMATNASMRLTRLHRRLGGPFWRLDSLGPGERAAMSWLCEIMALGRLAELHPDRVLWLDFDAFLAAPEAGLSAILRRLHGEAPPERITGMLRSGHLARYAKAPEHAFDGEARRNLLALAARDHREEIARGMAWLEGAASAHALVGQTLGQLDRLAP